MGNCFTNAKKIVIWSTTFEKALRQQRTQTIVSILVRTGKHTVGTAWDVKSYAWFEIAFIRNFCVPKIHKKMFLLFTFGVVSARFVPYAEVNLFPEEDFKVSMRIEPTVWSDFAYKVSYISLRNTGLSGKLMSTLLMAKPILILKSKKINTDTLASTQTTNSTWTAPGPNWTTRWSTFSMKKVKKQFLDISLTFTAQQNWPAILKQAKMERRMTT